MSRHPAAVSSARVWTEGEILFLHSTIMFGAARSSPLANHRHVPYPNRSLTPASSQDQGFFDSASVSLAGYKKKLKRHPLINFAQVQSHNNNSRPLGLDAGTQAQSSAHVITQLVTSQGLDDNQRQLAHEFHTAEDDIKVTVIYIQQLALDKKMQLVLQNIESSIQATGAVRALVNAAWTLTPAQSVKSSQVLCLN